MFEKDKGNLLAILDSARKIQKYTSQLHSADELFDNEQIFDAVLMNFVVIGEAVGRLSEKTLNEIAYVPWEQIKGFRNIIAHNYFGVDAEEVWQTIRSDVPELISCLEDELKNAE